jgi:hypothetical protein
MLTSKHKRREKSRRGTHECVRHALHDRWAEGPWGTGLAAVREILTYER